MKNGSCTIIMYEKDCGSKQSDSANGGKARIDVKKSDAMCDGIGKESFTTNCCRPIKRLILTSVNNWKDYAKQSRENDQN